mgnify:CR=1 FL=1
MDEVKQWKKIDPDKVDKMPVQTCIFLQHKPAGVNRSLFYVMDNKSDKYRPNDNMEGMKSGHKKI